MKSLEEKAINCPYCGEPITVLLNKEDGGDEYIEDCQVCCKPIVFSVSIDINDCLSVSVRAEDETY